MKFIVSSAILQKQLSAIQGVIASNPTLPILENLLLSLDKSTLTATASDLNVFMTTQVSVESSDTGSIAVPAKIFLDTLKNLPEQPVTIEANQENFSVEITAYSGKYQITGAPAGDYPRLPETKAAQNIDVDCSLLKKALSNTLFAVGADELRPAMTGLFFKVSADAANFVATDSHRLIRYTRTDVQMEEENLTNGLIVPKKALSILKGVLPEEGVMMQLNFSSSHAFFSFQQIRMIARLIDENFPDYVNAIPQNNTNELTIDRAEFLNALKRVAIFTNKTTHQIRLKLTTTQLEVLAEDVDFGNRASERLACDYQGEEMEIGFNVQFLIEMLSNLLTKEVVFSFSTPNRAGLLRPKQDNAQEDILMLVMPVMLNTYA
ncbi:MAG TPA: DNA polymerase III subunit beta [Microscillaceae bacterium]|nr:DNA polymerase III subunit beta [Microscillaceae bacterium]